VESPNALCPKRADDVDRKLDTVIPYSLIIGLNPAAQRIISIGQAWRGTHANRVESFRHRGWNEGLAEVGHASKTLIVLNRHDPW
jgi:hypothetical protein